MLNKIRMTLLFVSLVLILVACGSGTQIRKDDDIAKRNGIDLYQQQKYFEASNWLTQAWERNPADSEILIALLDSWRQLGEVLQIWQLLNETEISTAETRLIQAELALADKQCETALNLLHTGDAEYLSDVWLPRFWGLKANCLSSSGQHLQATLALIASEPLIEDQMARELLHDQIVKSLIQINDDELILAVGNPEYGLVEQGWIEAAYVNFGADGISGDNWLLQWPDHPAARYFLDLNQVNSQQVVAVLLPFSGRFSEVAKAIQKGLLTASVVDAGNQNKLEFYDTGSQGEGLASAWYSAQENGADMIIGPLDKASITAAASMPEATIPVVLLNQSEAPYFQFTLSPEGEAEQVAERMIQDGHKRVLIMAPNEDWGERMTKAFAQRFVDLGGQIVSNSYFQPQQNDYSAQLRQTLGLVESQLRARNLQQFLKLNLQADEVVRSDVDAIFLAARPAFARLMVPQLKFHHAAEIPVYATSHVFDGLDNEQHNRDLQNLMFALSPIQLQSSRLRETLPYDLNLIKANNKLFAFGYDAYQLIARLEWMSRVNTGIIDGLSGTVSLAFDGQFKRGLEWAQYSDGSVIALPH